MSEDFRRHWLEKRLSSKLGKLFYAPLEELARTVYVAIEGYGKTRIPFSTEKNNYGFELFRTNTTAEFRVEIEKFFKNLIILGLREGLEKPRAKFSDAEVTREYNRFMVQTKIFNWVNRLFEAFSNDFQMLLNSISSILFKNPNLYLMTSVLEIKKYLKDRAIKLFNRYYAGLALEMQSSINSARESKYKERDPANLFLYEWGIRRDNRTTDQCKEIVRLVEERKKLTGKKGVDINWLKATINQVALAYDPDFRVRDWTPHYNCRSVLKRVV